MNNSNSINVEENMEIFVENVKRHKSMKVLYKKVISELKQSYYIIMKKQTFYEKEEIKKMVSLSNIPVSNKVEKTESHKDIENNKKENFSEMPIFKNNDNQIESERKGIVDTKSKADIIIYYKTLFDTIEEHIKENQKSSFHEERNKIFENLNKEIPYFLPNSLLDYRVKIELLDFYLPQNHFFAILLNYRNFPINLFNFSLKYRIIVFSF